jgi:hypothetical protein
VPRLVAQLQAIGVTISKRQLMRLLIDGQDDFLAEARDVLRAGLETASWITVDDTGARHQSMPPRRRGEPTASARRSVMTTSPGSALRAAKAA